MLVQVAEGVGGQVGSAVVLGFKELAGLDFGGVLQVRPALSDFLQLYLHHGSQLWLFLDQLLTLLHTQM